MALRPWRSASQLTGQLGRASATAQQWLTALVAAVNALSEATGDGTASSVWTRIVKTSDETIQSDTVLGNDNTLVVPMVAGTRYRIRMDVFYTSNAAADFQWSIVGPAVTRFFMEYSDLVEGGVRVDDAVNSDPGAISHTTATGDENHIWADILIEPSANGSFAFEWAQAVSAAVDTTVRRGSFMEYFTY